MPEPEWDDESRDLITAYDTLQRRTGSEGEYLPEATDPNMDPLAYSGARYIAKGPFTNWAVKARLDAVDDHRKQAGEKANLNGVFFVPERMTYE